MTESVGENRSRKPRRVSPRGVGYYAFVEPEAEKPNKNPLDQFPLIREAMGDWQPPIRVHPAQFDTFCQDFGLNPQEMLRVWNGEIAEHKGWKKAKP